MLSGSDTPAEPNTLFENLTDPATYERLKSSVLLKFASSHTDRGVELSALIVPELESSLPLLSGRLNVARTFCATRFRSARALL